MTEMDAEDKCRGFKRPIWLIKVSLSESQEQRLSRLMQNQILAFRVRRLLRRQALVSECVRTDVGGENMQLKNSSVAPDSHKQAELDSLWCHLSHFECTSPEEES